MWITSRRVELRRIEIASFGSGWTVGEATVDNAQFFDQLFHAEVAARDFGERLAEAGICSEISIRRRDGASNERFISVPMTPSEDRQP